MCPVLGAGVVGTLPVGLVGLAEKFHKCDIHSCWVRDFFLFFWGGGLRGWVGGLAEDRCKDPYRIS